jgi:hypothetical protein
MAIDAAIAAYHSAPPPAKTPTAAEPRKEALKDNERGSAQRDQRVGSKAGQTLTPLSFKSDSGADRHSNASIDCCLCNSDDHLGSSSDERAIYCVVRLNV